MDALRGICIVSMIIGHLALHSRLWAVSRHPWVDAASGFILMSGLVIGLVQRRVSQRSGSRQATIKIMRRVGLLYLAHVSIVALAIVMALWRPGTHRSLPDLDVYGGPLEVLWHLVTLQLSPTFLDILPLYIILLSLAALAVAALRAGRWKLVVVGSVALYTVGMLVGQWTTLPQQKGDPGYFNWATWQLLFMSALIVGWYWHQVRQPVASRAGVVTAGVVLLGGTAAAAAARVLLADGTTGARFTTWLLDKSALGPGRLILGWAAFVIAYRILDSAPVRRVARLLLTELERLGRRSLDSFVILSVAVAVLPTVTRVSTVSLAAQVSVFQVLVLCWLWAVLRDNWSAPAATRGGPRPAEQEPARAG
nr:OpgC domain-containing protein [Micromonospora tarapacensis]